MTFTAATLRGMIEGANERQRAYKFEYGQWHHYTCQNNADTAKLQRLPTCMTFTAAALRGMIEGANKRQKAYKFEYGQ